MLPLYNCALRNGLKDATDLAGLRSSRVFQDSGASKAKTRSPFVICGVLGTTCSALPEDLRLHPHKVSTYIYEKKK